MSGSAQPWSWGLERRSDVIDASFLLVLNFILHFIFLCSQLLFDASQRVFNSARDETRTFPVARGQGRKLPGVAKTEAHLRMHLTVFWECRFQPGRSLVPCSLGY